MSDDDLIRRGDARRILEEGGFLERSLANLNDLQAMQVAVKPLEWVEIRHGQYFEARVIGILYSVRLGTDAIARWQAGHMGTWRDAPTIEAAKAAAQADYDARIRSALTVQPSPDEHYDDYCIGQFAKMMSEKMAASRAKGRSGWNDPEKCSVEYLRSLLYEHLDKGDPVDVANFCMMLRHYEASTYREACNCQPQPSPDVAALVEAAKWAMSHVSAMPMDESSQSEFQRHRAALARVKGPTEYERKVAQIKEDFPNGI